MRRRSALGRATIACAAGALSLVANQSALAHDHDRQDLLAERPADSEADAKLARIRARFLADREAEQRLQDLGWSLVRGNAPFCSDARSSIGLQIQDARAFGNPALIRSLLGRSGDFTVRTVADGSPAALAGISPNMAVLAIDGERLGTWPVDPERSWARSERAHELMARSLAGNGEVTLLLEGGITHTITGEAVCATRFEMAPRSDTAFADGARVRFGREFPAFAYPSDEFAAAIAHELAHNLLQHREWLDENGRTTRNIRKTEREADRLMPWLIANAGYDPAAAARYMRRWGPEHGSGIFRKRTHQGWDERAALIEAETAIVIGHWDDDEKADWRRHFRREVSP